MPDAIRLWAAKLSHRQREEDMITHAVLLHDPEGAAWLAFRNPLEVIEVFDPDEVAPALARVQAAVDQHGLHAAGALAYEAAPAFDRACVTKAPAGGMPLLWFGLYRGWEPFALPPVPTDEQDLRWQEANRAEHGSAIAVIKERIAAGDSYQVNYSMRLMAPFSGDAWRLFLQMLARDAPGYSAYLDLGRFAICSVSPELFFKLDGSRLLCRPMKGTVRRGRYREEDEERARWLAQSAKNRAENAMIVDMIRSDLGRIAEVGSVAVDRLCALERYPTVWQMTSTVTARTPAKLTEIMAALFPCASITGAPKIKTMAIIAELEGTPRGIYTGAIGYLAPGRKAQFSVAIRTVCVDRDASRVDYGVGGGILFESDAEEEYEECLAKSSAATHPWPPFSLLETLRWTAGEGYFLLDLHLARLAESAAYFGFPFREGQIHDRLHEAVAALATPRQRVRLLLDRSGTLEISASELALNPDAVVMLGRAPAAIDSQDVFRFHKSTHRQMYDRARAAQPGLDDVVLWNERGEVTETTSCNIIAELGGRMITPARTCGLLAGTYRRMLLERGEIEEAVITLEELSAASRLWVINSVRGQREAKVR